MGKYDMVGCYRLEDYAKDDGSISDLFSGPLLTMTERRRRQMTVAISISRMPAPTAEDRVRLERTTINVRLILRFVNFNDPIDGRMLALTSVTFQLRTSG